MKFVDYIIYTIVKKNHSIEKAYFKDLYRKGYILFLVPILGMFGIEIPSGSTIIILIFVLWVIWSFYRSSNISKKKEPMKNHEKFKDIKNKFDEHFSEKPGK